MSRLSPAWLALVVAIVTLGCGIASSPVAPPPAPSALVVTPLPSSQINLGWVDNSSNEDGFRIERCPGAGCTNFAQIAQTGPNNTSYLDAGLAGGTTYSYRVRAFNSGGNSAYSNTASATTQLPSPPAAPTNLTATAASSSQIDLSWTDNATNEDGFKVERCQGAGCTSFVQVAQLPPNTTSYSDTGLSANTTYAYRVRAFNANGNSAYSNVAGATTPGPPSGTDSLLAGMTPSNFTVPAGWTVAATQDFESGSVPAGQFVNGTVVSNFGHRGTHSVQAVIAADGSTARWGYDQGQLPGREYYVSFYDYGQGALFNEEYVIQHTIKRGTGGPVDFQEMGFSIGYAPDPNGGYVYNSLEGALQGASQGNRTVGFYGPSIGNYGTTGWNQWEVWHRANTPNLSDGFLRIYLNGRLVWAIENFNFNGSVDMTGMDVEAGGWYSKNVWTNNGQYPPNGTCSPAPGVGSEAGTWIGSFATVGPQNCPPAPLIFKRYIDDVLLLKK